MRTCFSLQEIETSEPCNCIHFSENNVIYGTGKFYILDIKQHVVKGLEKKLNYIAQIYQFQDLKKERALFLHKKLNISFQNFWTAETLHWPSQFMEPLNWTYFQSPFSMSLLLVQTKKNCYFVLTVRNVHRIESKMDRTHVQCIIWFVRNF